ncbi:hypothetical protein S40288_05335 [Stachybotrys chartarum IBT 40288]|nr:hypothetical protein S40288_05335 [Stachybotrys chartarum IBT 40288]
MAPTGPLAEAYQWAALASKHPAVSWAGTLPTPPSFPPAAVPSAHANTILFLLSWYPMMRPLRRRGKEMADGAAGAEPEWKEEDDGSMNPLPYATVLKGYFILPRLTSSALHSQSGNMLADLFGRDFPSLSGNSQLPSANQASMWSNAGSRPVQRNQPTPISSQPTGQEDLFSAASSRMPNGQGSFRFSNQGNILQASQVPPSSIDDFPPLNRTANGEISSERGPNPMSSLGFGPQNGSAGVAQPNRGNGLLNALSANSRASEARTPPGINPPGSSRLGGAKSPGSGDDGRQKSIFQGDGPAKKDEGVESRNLLGAIGNSATGKLKEDKENQSPEAIDPLTGMAEVDKWGIKGLRTLMNNYPDYHAMVVGMDPASLGIDMASQELLSTQVYSLFEDAPPRPTVNAGKFRVPECYNVTNVQPIESKIPNFNEETLFWIFYSCPADVKQQLAAEQLHNRNWRWHKKLRIWLTKDEHMTPQILSPSHERGYYIVWDTNNWRKDRGYDQREFTLHYGDLDTTLNQA